MDGGTGGGMGGGVGAVALGLCLLAVVIGAGRLVVVSIVYVVRGLRRKI